MVLLLIFGAFLGMWIRTKTHSVLYQSLVYLFFVATVLAVARWTNDHQAKSKLID